ncbi:MAG: hypothetical protein V1793_08110 [Pseudomonadota bacterium]
METHPQVSAVAVIGVPDDALGERVKAIIEPVQPDVLTPQIMKEFLKDKLAKYKIPELIDIVSTLPRNPTGKVLKYKLREGSAAA